MHGLARALAKRGHDVEVFTTNADGRGVTPVPLGVPVNLDGVKISYFPCALGRRIYRAPAMRRALAHHVLHVDLVHTHSVFLWPPLMAARIAKSARVPHIMSPRGMLVPDLIAKKRRLLKSTWIRFFERRTIEQANAVHVTSELEANNLRQLGLKPRKVAVIANGIDLPNRFNPRVELGNPYLLSLGRISWKKGIDRLIDAMQYIQDVELVIAGNDEERLQPELEKRVADYGLTTRVRFAGEVHGEIKWSLISGASVFVLPSHNENFGIAVLEAMACGVPVVVTPQVGLASIVENNGAGIVTSGDPITLASSVSTLMGDGELRRSMGLAGRAAAENMFSWEAIAKQIEALYYAVIAEQHERDSAPKF